MKRYFVYKYFRGDTLLYVGQTINWRTRYNDHKRNSQWFIEHDRYEVAEVDNKTTMDMYELYYINLLDPIYNIKDARSDCFDFTLPELSFRVIDMTNESKIPSKMQKKQKAIKVSIKDSIKLQVDNVIQWINTNDIDIQKKDEDYFIITYCGDIIPQYIFKLFSFGNITIMRKMISYEDTKTHNIYVSFSEYHNRYKTNDNSYIDNFFNLLQKKS